MSKQLVITPGQHLSNMLDNMQMGVDELMEESRLDRETIKGILNGDKKIDKHIAESLGYATRTESGTWMALQRKWDRATGQLTEEDDWTSKWIQLDHDDFGRERRAFVDDSEKAISVTKDGDEISIFAYDNGLPRKAVTISAQALRELADWAAKPKTFII